MHGPLLYLVATERPLINVDATLLMNIGIWLLLFFFLKAAFWKPMLAVIAAREEGIDGARKIARDLEKDAKARRDEFDLRLREARAAAATEREKIRAEGVRAENEILMAVRNEVAARVEKQRGDINAQRERLRADVLASVPALATDIANRLLGREVRS